MGGVNDVNGGRNYMRMSMHAVKVGSNQLPIPGPVILGIAGGMHAGVSSTMLDVSLEGGLLVGIQNVAGGQQKNHGVIAREVGVGENRCVFRKVDGDALARRYIAQGRDSVGDRGMAKGPRF